MNAMLVSTGETCADCLTSRCRFVQRQRQAASGPHAARPASQIPDASSDTSPPGLHSQKNNNGRFAGSHQVILGVSKPGLTDNVSADRSYPEA